MLAIAAVGGLSGSAAATGEHALELDTAGLEPTTALSFAIAPGAGSQTKLVYLRPLGGASAEAKDVRLTLELSVGTATLTRQNAASAAIPFTIAAGTQEQVQITVDVPAGKDATGTLVAVVAGKAEKLADVKVDSQAEPAVAIAENSGGIKRKATVTDFSLFLTLKANQKEAKSVSVDVTSFADSDGRQVPVTVAIDGKSGPVDIPALGSARVTITTQVPRAGDYSGGIVVTHDAMREEPVSLTITRTQVQPTVEILSFLPLMGANLDKTKLEALVHETSGSPLVLERPVIIPLGRKNGETRTGPSFSASGVKIQVADAETGVFKDVGRTLSLAGGQTVTLRMTILDADEPGDYAARLRLSTSDSQGVVEDAAFQLRRCAWLAGLLIGFGVILSFLVREILMKKGAKARQGLQVRDLIDDLDRLRIRHAPLDPEARAAFGALESRIRGLYERDGVSDLAAGIEKVNLQITLLAGWLRIRLRLKALAKPTEAQYSELADVYAHAVSSSDSKETLTAALEKSRLLDVSVAEGLRKQIETEVQLLLQSATAATASGGNVTHPTAKTKIEGEVIPALNAALARLTETGDDDARLLAATSALTSARQKYASALLEDLRLTLAADAAPAWFEQAEWEALRRHVDQIVAAAGTDPARQLDAYRAAFGAYLASVAMAAGAEAERRLTAVTPAPGVSPTPAQREAQQHYAKAVDAARSIPPLLAEGKVAPAHAAYETAVAEIAAGNAAPGLAAVESDGAESGPPRVALPPISALTPPVGDDAWRDLRKVLDEGRLRRIVRRSEWLIAVISGVLATVVGLELLYDPNKTWGSLTDMALAVLWGVGLHQVTGQTVQGYRGVQTALTAP